MTLVVNNAANSHTAGEAFGRPIVDIYKTQNLLQVPFVPNFENKILANLLGDLELVIYLPSFFPSEMMLFIDSVLGFRIMIAE